MERGQLVLVENLPVLKLKSKNFRTRYNYIYQARYKCFCGEIFIARKYDVVYGKTTSCGCYNRGKITNTYIDGRTHTRLYHIFINMYQRITNIKNPSYKNYGGRGITICKEWEDYAVFESWAHKNGYTDDLTIDRIDNDLEYSPSNCRWVTRKIQRINQRVAKNTKNCQPGVHPYKDQWTVLIGINNTQKYLGKFNSFEEASIVYEKAKKERDEQYFKEFEQSKKQNKK